MVQRRMPKSAPDRDDRDGAASGRWTRTSGRRAGSGWASGRHALGSAAWCVRQVSRSWASRSGGWARRAGSAVRVAMRARVSVSSWRVAAMSRSRSASRPAGIGGPGARARRGRAARRAAGRPRPVRAGPARAQFRAASAAAQSCACSGWACSAVRRAEASNAPHRAGRSSNQPATWARSFGSVGRDGTWGRQRSAQSVSCSPARATAPRRRPSRPGPSSTTRAAARRRRVRRPSARAGCRGPGRRGWRRPRRWPRPAAWPVRRAIAV